VAVLGIAYKADVDDARESPAFEIIKELKNQGARVLAFDPFVKDKSDVNKIDLALKGADAVIIATGHSQFKKLRARDFKKYGIDIVVDGRNCLKRADIQGSGVAYFGIGR
jgi:UDP-N-acetyl-D-mannosaminuronate dehydrogenase